MRATLSDCKAVALASPMLGNQHGRSSEKSLLTKTVAFSDGRTLRVSYQLIHSLQPLGHNGHDLDGEVRRLFYQELKATAIDRD